MSDYDERAESERDAYFIETLEQRIAKLEAENAELLAINRKLKAQRNTAYGYGSDAGMPPWME